MDSKKDIGNVFKDRLGDLKEAPSANLWDAIASEIDQGSRKRILPFWYYLGGSLLGILFLGLLLWSPWESNNSNNTSVTTASDQSKENTLDFNTKITNPLNNNYAKGNYQNKQQYNIADQPHPLQTDSEVYASNSKSKDDTSAFTTTSETKRDTILSTTTYLKHVNHKPVHNPNNLAPQNKSNNAIIINNSQIVNTSLEDIQRMLANRTTSNTLEEQKARELYNAKIRKELQDAIYTQRAENEKNYQVQLQKEALKKQLEKEVTLKAALLKAQQEKETTKRISSKPKKLPLTEEERAFKRQAATEYKVAFSPYTSIIKYGSLVRGSSIDDRLVNNPRESIGTVGYGFRVDFPLSTKSSIRLGAGVAPLEFRTDDFQVSIVDGNVNIFQLTAINAQDFNQPNLETSPEAQNFFDQNQVVSIRQNISYLEVPVDYQYRFINKQLGLSINSGLSLFVLNDNSVFAASDSGQSLLIGRQTNLRDLSIALNLGLSAHYNISKRWRFNAEPAVKYQLNPFIDSNTNFRPYYFGMQFGLSFKY